MNPTRTQQMVEAETRAYEEGLTAVASPLQAVYGRQARELTVPESPPMVRQGEVVPVAGVDGGTGTILLRDTLADPDSAAMDASIKRTGLLQQAGALELGIDAANTIGASNSLEKCLVHQMALCHKTAMELMVKGASYSSARPEEAEYGRKTIALASRLMTVFQQGMETLTRARTAGRQTITVKQVHVSGGQAVIAETVRTTGGHRVAGRVKKR